jgi:hypothetical protein
MVRGARRLEVFALGLVDRLLADCAFANEIVASLRAEMSGGGLRR